jgi:hypothetical protein
MPAIPGYKPPVKALCVVPQGMQEGTELLIEGREFGLVTGRTLRGRHWRSRSEFPLVEAARVPRRAIPILRSRIELSKDFGRERQRPRRS